MAEEIILADVPRARLEQRGNEVKLVLVCCSIEEATLTLHALADQFSKTPSGKVTLHFKGHAT